MADGYPVGNRGQYASTPSQMPWRAWRQVLSRVRADTSANNISVVAAGVAFYGFLSLFPGLIALVSLYALITDEADIQAQLDALQGVMPAAANQLIADALARISQARPTSLSLGLIFSTVFALWSATKGTKALMTALNIAYREKEARSFIRQNVFAVLFTAGAILFAILSLALVAGIPAAVALLEPSGLAAKVVMALRWVILAALVLIAITVLYRFAPHRDPARVPWIMPGAMAACALWLILSALFSLYVQNFGNYDKTFGSLAAVVILLMWIYLSAFVICVGAEINAELEYQTYRDSTVGPPRRAGLRGAYVADFTWENPSDS